MRKLNFILGLTALAVIAAVGAWFAPTLAQVGGINNLYVNTLTATGGVNPSSTVSPFTAFSTPPVYLVGNITDTTDVSGKIWYSQVFIPTSVTLTGVCALDGTATTDSFTMGLYSMGGTLLAHSALTGAALTASVMSCQAFTATYPVVGPQSYLIAIQGNGTTAASFYAYGATNVTGFITGAQTGGTFGTLGAITAVATSFTASVGPVASVY